MLAKLKAYWDVLIAKEHKLFKSVTVYYAAFIAALPDLLQAAQSSYPTLVSSIPHALQDPVLHWIAAGIFIARAHTLVQSAAATLPAAPAASPKSHWLAWVVSSTLLLALGCALSNPSFAAGGLSATWTWTASATNTDGSTITATPVKFNVYAGPAGQEALLSAGTLLGAPTFTLNVGLTLGQTICAVITEVDSLGRESAPSNEACKSFIAPNPPTANTVK